MTRDLTLRDHFRPPLSTRRHWHSFHNSWATYIAADLNRRLPEGWFAEANVQFGIEIDVAAFEDSCAGLAGTTSSASDATECWSPGSPGLTVALPVLSDVVEVRVYDSQAGPVLAGAVELISPSNKDRTEQRDAFVSKCASYVQNGVGLVIVDVVTSRKANLHTALLQRLFVPVEAADEEGLYAAAYHPVRRGDEPLLDLWHEPLSVGGPLPHVPLWLRGGPVLPVDLEGTYQRTCAEQRLDLASA
ncbi:MAG TPA: DUF4058 family protein [Planctomycetaceae bacterium]|nr:DUF4058 family protein [Planctomycetaceae bacterium]